MTVQKRRPINAYNILRCVAALCVLAYHLNGNDGWSFGVLNPLFQYATFYMTMFFMLSGFVLAYNYCDYDFLDLENFFAFMKKRVIAIFPVYWLVYFFFVSIATTSLIDIIITFPVQFLLLQEFEHYGFLQNDGMWFLSVMLICYCLFPFILYVVKGCNKHRKNLFIMLWLLDSVIPLIGVRFGLNIYTNIFCRLLEFCMGVVLFCVVSERKETLYRINYILMCMLCFFLLIAYYFLQKAFINLGYHATLLNAYNLVAIIILLIVGYRTPENSIIDRVGRSRGVTFFSNISLEIYCGTGIGFLLFLKLVGLATLKLDNKGNILLASSVITMVACILKIYEKYTTVLIKKVGLNKYIACVAIAFCILIMLKCII